jgi:hypothetical protein
VERKKWINAVTLVPKGPKFCPGIDKLPPAVGRDRFAGWSIVGAKKIHEFWLQNYQIKL